MKRTWADISLPLMCDSESQTTICDGDIDGGSVDRYCYGSQSEVEELIMKSQQLRSDLEEIKGSHDRLMFRVADVNAELREIRASKKKMYADLVSEKKRRLLAEKRIKLLEAKAARRMCLVKKITHSVRLLLRFRRTI